MNAGSRRLVLSNPKKSESDPFNRVPYSKPPFTLSQLKKAIPSHCFQRSVLRSFSYLIYDLISIFILYHVATNYFRTLPRPLTYVAWPLYWAMQGCVSTGIWVIAHECGHHAFSDHQWLNDTVGFILHSLLLVPYFSLKYSHRRHHSNTGSLEKDEVFVPKKKTGLNRWFKKYFNNPPGRFLSITIHLTIGWPLYLVFNITGRPYDRYACHFNPYGPIFTDRERLQIYASDAGVLAVIYVLYYLIISKGLTWVLFVYGVPLMIVNGFLVMVTYLQHTHPSLPRYDSSEWDWLRGALSTVDRDYGILNKVFHNINDTHVTHHLFPTMPHYHATTATEAMKPVLGEYYRFDRTPVYKALFREMKECVYVEPDENEKDKGVLWFKNKI